VRGGAVAGRCPIWWAGMRLFYQLLVEGQRRHIVGPSGGKSLHAEGGDLLNCKKMKKNRDIACHCKQNQSKIKQSRKKARGLYYHEKGLPLL